MQQLSNLFTETLHKKIFPAMHSLAVNRNTRFGKSVLKILSMVKESLLDVIYRYFLEKEIIYVIAMREVIMDFLRAGSKRMHAPRFFS